MEGLNPYKEKLIIPRDLEGEPNAEVIKILRQFETELEKYEWFVAVVPFGSTSLGYNNESSDIDVKIIYDVAQTENDKNFREHIKGLKDNLEKSERVKIHTLLSIFNVDAFDGEIAWNQLYTVENLAAFTRIAIGEKVESYREKIKQILGSLSVDEQEKVKGYILEHLLVEDEASFWKLVGRKGLSPGSRNEFQENRKSLWTKRISDLWSI